MTESFFEWVARFCNRPTSRVTPTTSPASTGLAFGAIGELGHYYRVRDSQLLRHVHVMGREGRHDFITHLLRQQAVRGGGFFYLDSSLDLAALTSFQETGREIVCIAPDYARESVAYNPLSTNDTPELVERAMLVIPSASLPDAAREALRVFLRVLADAAQAVGRQVTFHDLGLLLMYASSLDWLRGLLAGNSPEAIAFDKLKAQWSTESGEWDRHRLLATFGGAAARLAYFCSGRHHEVLGHASAPDFISGAIQNNACVYLGLPRMSKDAHALAFGAMALREVVDAVSVRASKPVHSEPPFLIVVSEVEALQQADAMLCYLLEKGAAANCIIVFASITDDTHELAPPFIREGLCADVESMPYGQRVVVTKPLTRRHLPLQYAAIVHMPGVEAKVAFPAIGADASCQPSHKTAPGLSGPPLLDMASRFREFAAEDWAQTSHDEAYVKAASRVRPLQSGTDSGSSPQQRSA